MTLQPQPRAYLASLRRELRSLATTLDPARAGGLNYCVDQIVSQLIVRDEAADTFHAELDAAIRRTAAEAGVALPAPGEGSASERRTALLHAVEAALLSLPSGSPQRRLLEIGTSRADDTFRGKFSAAAATVAAELNAAVDPPGWGLAADRVASLLPRLEERWRGARVERLEPVGGVHAKEIYFLDLTLANGESEALVLRCDRPVDLTRASVIDEFPLLQALFARGFPIPEALHAIDDASWLGQPALIMRRVGGVEKQIEAIGNPRRTIQDAACFLARLHATPIADAGLADIAGEGGAAAMWRRRIAAQFEWWRDMAIEPAPVMWRARRWLEDNLHLVADVATVAHGDFSLRNLLLNDDDSLASVLDWELAGVGHPAQDLGYLRATVDSVMPWGEFDAMYRAAGGRSVTREQIAYFDVWGLYRNLAINATVQNVFLDGKTTDYFLGTAAITYYPGLLSQLTEAIERVD